MIVDASAVVDSLSRPRLTRTMRGTQLAAPDLLVPETLNAFWKIARRGTATPDRRDILEALDRIRIVPSRPLAGRATELAARFDHPVYDCLYLALAEAESDVLLTGDKRLVSKVTDRTLRRYVRLLDVR